jgi:ATP-dependent RNA helicase RhlE
MPKLIEQLAQEYLSDPVRVEVTPPGKTADRVDQFVHYVTGKDQKTAILRQALTDNPAGRAMVFLRTKHSAEKLAKHLANVGFAATSIHGNKSQSQRERSLKAFREGEAKVLVATDVAARGIDIPDVTHVYNYDLPTVPDAYVHRIGRTARAGKEGIAVAFCAPEDIKLLRDIEKLTKVTVQIASGEAPEENVRGSQTPRGGRGAKPSERKPHRKGQRPTAKAGEEQKRGEERHRPGRSKNGNRNKNAGQQRANGGQNQRLQAN